MTTTRFWMIRHAVVAENELALVYGANDVELCPHNLVAQIPMYRALARRLPPPGPRTIWLTSPLSRARRTAQAIFDAGYPRQQPIIEDGLIEIHFGDWQGLRNEELPARLTMPAHAFWPVAATERPPGGESMEDGIARVGPLMDRLAETYSGMDVVAVTHGGIIRAAAAHALRIGAESALSISVENLSLTRIDRWDAGWLVDCVNELPGV